uniref:Uncharacterized protein n=1 Tax=Avena sativa TaxID=4498 RepID=A0ACD6A2R8_AVESA
MSTPSLINDLVEQILLRLPPDDPAYLVCASLISKPVRRLLAGAAFRRRYREFHGRPHLLGFFEILDGDEPYYSRFVPTSVFCPAEPDHPDWLVVDCRHGRALFVTTNPKVEGTLDLVVWDPMTDKQCWVPQPSPSPEHYIDYSAAVLCAVEGCDHSGCQEGPFRVAFLSRSPASTHRRLAHGVISPLFTTLVPISPCRLVSLWEEGSSTSTALPITSSSTNLVCPACR